LAEAYPAQLAEELVETLQLDGSGVLLDVGCGTGSLTLLLAHW
jgi:cyclopropane fatty-acyl-phospholipid synthase-like methyltransferase